MDPLYAMAQRALPCASARTRLPPFAAQPWRPQQFASVEVAACRFVAPQICVWPPCYAESGGERGRRKHSELDCTFYFTACLWCAYEVRLAHAHAIYYRTNPCVIANVLGVPTENMKGNTCVFHTRFTIHPSGHAAILGTQSVASQTGVATPPECNQHHQWPQWSGTVRGSADNTWLTALARATRRNRKCPHH